MASTNVIVAALASGTEPGNLSLDTVLNYDGVTGTLSLIADNNIIINNNICPNSLCDISADSDRLNLLLRADFSQSGSGNVIVAGGVLIDTNNGRLTLIGSDIEIGAGATLDSGGGLMKILSSNGGTIGLGTTDCSSGPGSCDLSISGDELGSLHTYQLVIGADSNDIVPLSDNIFVDGISVGNSANISLVHLKALLDSGASINFVNGASTFNSLKMKATGDINVNANLNLVSSVIFANILLIDDQGGLQPASLALDEDGHTVTVIDGEFANNYINLTDLAFLQSFDLVVWGAQGDGVIGFDTLPQSVFDTLNAYIQGGGNLMITGRDSLGRTSDSSADSIASLIGSSTSDNLLSDDANNEVANWETANIDNFILNGVIGDFTGLTFDSPFLNDLDLLTAGDGTLSLASTGTIDRIIFQLSGGGSVGYWNGGDFSSINSQQDISGGSGTTTDIFRNWAAGNGTSFALVAETGGSFNTAEGATVDSGAGAVSISAVGDITLNSAGDLQLGSIESEGSVTITADSGSLFDGNADDPGDNITADTATLVVQMENNIAPDGNELEIISGDFTTLFLAAPEEPLDSSTESGSGSTLAGC